MGRTFEQDAEGGIGHEPLAVAGERGQQRPRRERCDVPTTHRCPYVLELIEPFRARVAGEGDGVQRTGRGTDDQVRPDAGLGQRPQHADLRRGQAATALEHERDPHRTEGRSRVERSHQVTSMDANRLALSGSVTTVAIRRGGGSRLVVWS
jgi:hypothetical protein